MSGPAPKPSHLRQRTNRKAGARVLPFSPSARPGHVPEIPNPDGREWHVLTLEAWRNAWTSPMASQWLPTDFDGLARLAVLWDNFNKTGHIDFIKEIRLQGAAFGLTPLDRSRLSWEVSRADEAEQKQTRRDATKTRQTRRDPRSVLALK